MARARIGLIRALLVLLLLGFAILPSLGEDEVSQQQPPAVVAAGDAQPPAVDAAAAGQEVAAASTGGDEVKKDGEGERQPEDGSGAAPVAAPPAADGGSGGGGGQVAEGAPPAPADAAPAAPQVDVVAAAAPPAADTGSASQESGEPPEAVHPEPPAAVVEERKPKVETGGAGADASAPTTTTAAAAASDRPNRRVAPRKSKSKDAGGAGGRRTEGAADEGGDEGGGWEGEGGEGNGEVADDYYGLNQDPVDRLDTAAFQPSHILSFEIQPSGMEELFDDISEEDVGKVVRGDWFVTSGDELTLQVIIRDPTGDRIYAEGPTTQETDSMGYTQSKPSSEGSFRFATRRVGTYRIAFFNPSPSSSRTVTFAWLLGKDDDDPFTSKRGRGSRAAAFAEAKGGAVASGDGSGLVDGGSEGGANVTSTVVSMMRRVSTIHKGLDDITAIQQFADVRFARHARTVESTERRVFLWTLAETGAVLFAAVIQGYVVRNFDYRGSQAPLRPNPYV